MTLVTIALLTGPPTYADMASAEVIRLDELKQTVELVKIDIPKDWSSVACAQSSRAQTRCQFLIAKSPVSATFYNAVLDQANAVNAQRATPSKEHGDAVKIGLHDIQQFLKALRTLTNLKWQLPNWSEWLAACESRNRKSLQRMDAYFSEWMRASSELKGRTYQDISIHPSPIFSVCNPFGTAPKRYFYNRSSRIGFRLTLPVTNENEK